jgi:glutathione S-transferase
MKPVNNTPLQITRAIKAQRNRVYVTWTDLELANQWWGPYGCETHGLVCDARLGGKFRWGLSTPDGEKMTAYGAFREARSNEKLAYTWQWEDDPQWGGIESLVTAEFRERDAATTELRLTHENFPSEQSRDNHIGGWNNSLDKLERLLAQHA